MLLAFSSQTVLAKDANVKDCLKGQADCTEIGKTLDGSKENPADQTDNNGESEAKAGSLFLGIVKTIAALALILFLIYVLLKFLSKRNKSFQRLQNMQNLGGIAVGPNKSVQLVRIGDKLFMLGVGDNVELLQEITDEDLKKSLYGNAGAGRDDVETRPSRGNLSTLLKMDKDPASDNTKGFRQLFSKELEKIKKNRQQMISKQQEEDRHHE